LANWPIAKAEPIELVEGDEHRRISRRRKRDIGEGALEPARLLQDEGTIVLRHHADPGEAERVHVAGFVHA